MLPMIFGALAPSLLTGMAPWMAAAIGSGVGSLMQGGSAEDALKSAAMGGIGAGIGGGFGDAAGAGTAAGGVNPANPNAFSGIDGVATTANAGMDFGGINATKFGSGAMGQSPMPIAPPQAGGMFDINPDFNVMSALKSPVGMAAGLGASMYTPEQKAKEEEEKVYPRGMPIKNTSIFPEYGYDGGKEGEFNYNIAKNYAEGGELEDPMAMEMGLGAMDGGAQEGGMNDKELISGAIDVIQGEVQNPEQQQLILGKFVAQFGQEALQDLVQKVQSGDIPNEPSPAEGKIEGAGDGMSDMVPASLGQEQDVLLSDGEFVVPADVVSGIGNGSSDAGSNKLEEMMDRVRQMRTGGMMQPPAIPDEMMLPV